MARNDDALLQDTLEQALLSPAASHGWHRLLAQYLATADAGLRQQAVERLLTARLEPGVACYLAATFLATATRNPAFVAEAGRQVQAIVPFHVDRQMGYLAYEWFRLLQETRDRAGFMAQLRTAQFPSILRGLGRHLCEATPLRPGPRPIERLRKVALVVPFLGAARHTPTAMALSQAQLLIDNGLETRLFACQELRVTDMHHFRGDAGGVDLALPDMTQWPSLMPRGLSVSICDDRYSMLRRWKDMLQQLADFDPDLVMLVGLYSPLLAPLFETRPVLGLSVHSVPPLAPVDVWLSADPALAGQAASPWAPEMPAGWGWHHPYRIRRLPATPPLPRLALGLEQDAVVLVTTGFRLKEEIRGAWAEAMLALLRQCPNVVWLLVGGAGELPAALSRAPAGQVRTLAARTDLASVYAHCDIYVNPPRMGGGLSVGEAMAEALPIVAYTESDGGNKIGPEALPDDQSYFARLAVLLREPGLRRQAGAAMEERFALELDVERSGPSLQAACELALERARQRLSPGSS